MFFLDEIRPRVFAVTFHDHYQLCMTFLRCTEINENPDFVGSVLNLEDFREYYTKHGEEKNFTYTTDWAGFNLTEKVIEKVWKRGLPDLNKWDQVLSSIYTMCKSKYPNEPFAVIGISREQSERDDSLLDHELAHALYYTNEEYAERVDKLFNELDPEIQDRTLQILASWDYSNNTFVDELNAYLATGFIDHEEFEILDSYENLTQIKIPFQQLYEEYSDKPYRRVTLHPYMGIWEPK